MSWSRQVLTEALRFEVGYAGGTCTVGDAFAVFRRLRAGGAFDAGEDVERYDEALSSFFGSRFVTTYGAARMAFYCLLRAMRLRDGDEIVLPGYNCIVIPNAIRFAGLNPVYVDIRECDYNLNPELIESALTARTRAI